MNLKKQSMLGAVSAFMTAGALLLSPSAPALAAEEDVQILTRGPVHEAFAESVSFEAQAGINPCWESSWQAAQIAAKRGAPRAMAASSPEVPDSERTYVTTSPTAPGPRARLRSKVQRSTTIPQFKLYIPAPPVVEPDIWFLDEPFSALDDQTREDMYALMREVRRATGATVLHVTHSRNEAQALGDRRFVLDQGRIVEQTSPATSTATTTTT